MPPGRRGKLAAMAGEPWLYRIGHRVLNVLPRHSRALWLGMAEMEPAAAIFGGRLTISG
jgi:hypothetical protein